MISKINPAELVFTGYFTHKTPKPSKASSCIDPTQKPQDLAEQYLKLVKIGKELLVESDIDRILCTAMDHLIKLSGAERGIMILCNNRGDLIFEAARNLDGEDIEHPEFEISCKIINKVKVQRMPVCLSNAIECPLRGKSNSTNQHKSLSFICTPLLHNGENFGVIYLDDRTGSDIFKPKTCSLVRMFADFISLAAHHVFDRKESYNRVHALEAELRGNYRFESIIGHHPKLVEVLDLVARVADTDATILLQGESGTGKELTARAIHYNSSRRNKPFLAINCGALPDSLLESELFGHERGAYTGAVQKTIGKFAAAHGGTMFLDEVDAMSSAVQVKLLRVLQSGEYSPLGSTQTKFSDVRIVAAAHPDLRVQVAQGKFREDLFYRLNIVPIFLPALRNRKEDIPLLIDHFLNEFAHTQKKPTISTRAERILQHYDYPGNVRELENAIYRAVILSGDNDIDVEYLPEEMLGTIDFAGEATDVDLPFHEAKARIIEAFENDYLVKILAKHRGVISRAAKEAGLNRKNFREKISRWDIDIAKFK